MLVRSSAVKKQIVESVKICGSCWHLRLGTKLPAGTTKGPVVSPLSAAVEFSIEDAACLGIKQQKANDPILAYSG